MYKFRASAMHRLMTSGRRKDETFGLTAYTFMREVWIAEKFGRYPAGTSKHMVKGVQNEEAALTLFTEVDGNLYMKNESHFKDDHFTGTPDIIKGALVIDIKNSWDIFTFFEADVKPEYNTQLQVYMALTGCTSARLVYCLTSAPEWMVTSEKNRLFYQMGGHEMPDHASAEYMRKSLQIEKNITFDDIDKAKRVKAFDVVRDEAYIETMRARVVEANSIMATW